MHKKFLTEKDKSRKKLSCITENKLWLAPLSGFTDSVFRQICKGFGADVVVTEMISAHGLVYGSKKTELLTHFEEIERPIGIQIFGNEARIISDGISFIKKFHPDFIDINMGCPMKKVVENKSGSALLLDIEKLKKIVSEAQKTVGNEFPLTVKIRSGWNSAKNLDRIVKAIESSGASAIIFHPRTRKQMFSGKSNWNLITRVKKEIRIPLIGNGDIATPEDAKKMYKETGCHSIMIGRAAVGNPWIFRQIKEFLATKDYARVKPQEKLSMILSHFEMLSKVIGADHAVKLIRKYIPGYTKGLKGSKKLRRNCNRANNETEFKKIVHQFIEKFYKAE